MENDFILQIITAILCFVSILFGVFLLFVKSKNKLGNRILALFIFVRAIDASVLIYGNYIDLHPALDVLRHDIGGFFQSPLLFLFVLSIIYKNFKLKIKHLLLSVPFIIATLFSIPRYYLYYLGFNNTLLDNFPLSFEITLTYTLAVLQNLGLILVTFFILIRYKKILLENYSNTDNYNYRWLFHLNIISSFLFLAALIKNIYKFQDTPVNVVSLRILVMSISLIFICWLVYKALSAPKLFRGIDSKLQLISTNGSLTVNNSEKAHNELISNKINQLKSYMLEKEPYLDSELTIANLANQLEMNVTDLSIIINHKLSKNFHTFINEYRISNAKTLLKDASKKHTIQEILYKVGFNSKSSFNVSFKELTGLTPSQYKNKNL